MSAYPDWVKNFREKGTAIKKVGNTYYLYKVTSRRVPGKKYPQTEQSFIGAITPEGVIKTKIRKVSTETVRVYEYGLSYTLSKIIPKKFIADIGDEVKANYIFLNIVKQYSPDSYLLREVVLPTAAELHTCLGTQIKKYERLTGITIEDLHILTRIYLVETKECDMISLITPEMKEVMQKAGVNADDIQK